MLNSEIYDVYAVRYAHSPARPASENFLRSDAHDVDMPLDFFVWLIRNAERTILVDTGFTRETARVRGHCYLADIDHLLDDISVDRKGVSDVVVTHMHWDHAGNFDICPKATLHVQESEMHFVTGRDMESPLMRRPVSADDVCAAVRLLHDGRLRCRRGEYRLAPGVLVTHVGGHTPGHQVVRVATNRGWLVLASDAAHFYANMEQLNPFPVIYNVADNVRSWRTVAELADGLSNVIPGHDPLVMERFPALSDDLAEHVVVLSA